MKKITYIAIGLVLILLIVLVVKNKPSSFGAVNGIVGVTSITDSSSTVGVNAVQVMATSSGLRKWLYIANDGAGGASTGANAYCLLNSTTTGFGAVNQQGIVLASSTGILNMDASVYSGQIWCATKAGTTTLNVVVGQ